MKYIDNGSGDPLDDALFPWLTTVLTEDVVGIRWQSGFFESSVLGVFEPVLKRLAREGREAIVLVGSNDGETRSSAVHELVDLLGLPRSNASLGVVRYADGFYHAKTLYLRYADGRELAYVGSANLTSRGINGLNVEAGILCDTEDGDSVECLAHIKQAAKQWFTSNPKGLFIVESHDDVNRLESNGILTHEPTPRPLRADAGASGPGQLPSRGLVHTLPPMPSHGGQTGGKLHPKHLGDPDSSDRVLIAELVGPGRWSQSAFPQWFIRNFFAVLPNGSDVLHLWPVTEAAGVGAAEKAKCGFKPGSTNWYFELGLATQIGAYPRANRKPIGVFHRTAHQTCRYTILMPDDESYARVEACLAANRLVRRKNELRRAIVPAEVLRNAWPRNWFFGA